MGNDYVAILSEFITEIYSASQAGHSINDVSEVLLPGLGPVRLLEEETLREGRRRLEEAVRYAQAKPLTEEHIRKIVARHPPRRARILLRVEEIVRNPFGDLSDRATLPPAETQLAAVTTLLAVQEIQQRYVQRWNEAVRANAEVQKYGDPRIWGQQWKYLPDCQRDDRCLTCMGLPGSGKTHLTAGLLCFLSGQQQGSRTVMFDGDMDHEEYMVWAPSRGLAVSVGGQAGRKVPQWRTREARLKRAPQFAKYLTALQHFPNTLLLVSSFLPYDAQRLALYHTFFQGLVLVHVQAPIEVCRERVKSRGYRQDVFDDHGREPGIKEFEPPCEHAEVPATVTVDTATTPLYRSIEQVVRALAERGWIAPAGRWTDFSIRAKSFVGGLLQKTTRRRGVATMETPCTHS